MSCVDLTTRFSARKSKIFMGVKSTVEPGLGLGPTPSGLAQ
jgi:hypothetical protein